jgi:hypothetical protein
MFIKLWRMTKTGEKNEKSNAPPARIQQRIVAQRENSAVGEIMPVTTMGDKQEARAGNNGVKPAGRDPAKIIRARDGTKTRARDGTIIRARDGTEVHNTVRPTGRRNGRGFGSRNTRGRPTGTSTGMGEVWRKVGSEQSQSQSAVRKERKVGSDQSQSQLAVRKERRVGSRSRSWQ